MNDEKFEDSICSLYILLMLWLQVFSAKKKLYKETK